MPMAAKIKRIFLASLLVFGPIVPGHLVRAQATEAGSQPQSRRPNLLMSVGPSIVEGGARQMTGAGAFFQAGLKTRPANRLSYTYDFFVDYHTVPSAILAQAQRSRGSEDFLSFLFDPAYSLARNARWTAYVIGGGGLSLKYVAFLSSAATCDPEYGCSYPVASSETSLQPAIDGGIGTAFRIHPDRRASFFAEARIFDIFVRQRQFPGFNTSGTRLLLPFLGIQF
jgi:hypothetical protein